MASVTTTGSVSSSHYDQSTREEEIPAIPFIFPPNTRVVRGSRTLLVAQFRWLQTEGSGKSSSRTRGPGSIPYSDYFKYAHDSRG